VSRQVGSTLELDDVLNRVVSLIRDILGYDSARVFFLQGDHLTLKAHTQALPPALQVIPVESNSLNGLAIRTDSPVVSNDIAVDPNYLSDGQPDLTRSEIAIPLRVGDRILGTLDVTSNQIAAFGPEDVRLIEGLADQVAIAIENAHLFRRSRELAVIEERGRLARDLHDSVLQNLYSLNLLSEGWRRKLRLGEVENADGYFDRVGEITRQALREMRLMIHQLRPSTVELEGLVGALQRRLATVENRSGMRAMLQADQIVNLPPLVEDNLYFIAQEALNNTLKHSGALHLSNRTQAALYAVKKGLVDLE
jgi:signal transduction histidine kinase